jgi:hypothetical protein
VKALRSLLIVSLLAVATTATAQSPWSYEFHGTFGGSMYVQNNRFNNEGQNPYIALQVHPLRDKLIFGGDARQTKLVFHAIGPQVVGATPRAVIEYDLFGGAGPGNYSESELTRLRVAYIQLDWGGRTYVQVGQQNHLMLNQVPVTVGHLSAPLTLGTGYLGWRTPGVTAFHKIPIMDKVTFEIAGQVSRQNFNDNGQVGAQLGSPAAFPGAVPGGVPLGRAGFPNTELRAKVEGSAPFPFQVYVVGHYSEVDASGFNNQLPPTSTLKDTLTSTIGEVGGKVSIPLVPVKITLAANFYTGKNTCNIRGQIEQCQTINAAGGAFADVNDTAFWGQLGIDFGPWSVWGFYGDDTPKKSDMAKAFAASTVRLENTNISGLLKYTDGAMNFGFEYLNTTTNYGGVTGAGTANPRVVSTDKAHAEQYMVSAAYVF